MSYPPPTCEAGRVSAGKASLSSSSRRCSSGAGAAPEAETTLAQRSTSEVPVVLYCSHSATNLEQGRGLRLGRLHKPLLLRSLRLKATSAPRPAAAAAHIPIHPFLLCGSTLHYSSGQFKPPLLFYYRLPASTFPSRHCKRNDDS